MHLAADRAIPDLELNLLKLFDKQEFNITYFQGDEFSYLDQKDIDILLIRSTTKINETTLNNHSIKFIGSVTSGIDHLDINFLKQIGIEWGHAPGCNAWSVVHYVMSALEVIYSQGLGTIGNGVGIVGYGNIGSRLASVLKALRIPYSVFDPFVFSSSSQSIKDALCHDVVTLHVPLSYTGNFPTYHLINRKELEELKFKTLINTSRGGVINESILNEFSSINLILDVWEQEPVIEERFFRESFLYTPHIAGYSIDGKNNGTRMIIQALASFLGRSISNELISIPGKQISKAEFLKFQENFHSYSFPTGLFSKSLDLFEIMYSFKQDFERGESLSSIREKHPPRRDFIHDTFMGEKLENLEILSKLIDIY
ncbi:MAG: 4-phosphoerythronate dehydrogenase [Gammaproteobacteria bacterium]